MLLMLMLLLRCWLAGGRRRRRACGILAPRPSPSASTPCSKKGSSWRRSPGSCEGTAAADDRAPPPPPAPPARNNPTTGRTRRGCCRPELLRNLSGDDKNFKKEAERADQAWRQEGRRASHGRTARIGSLRAGDLAAGGRAPEGFRGANGAPRAEGARGGANSRLPGAGELDRLRRATGGRGGRRAIL
jgi:hypothetical protein